MRALTGKQKGWLDLAIKKAMTLAQKDVDQSSIILDICEKQKSYGMGPSGFIHIISVRVYEKIGETDGCPYFNQVDDIKVMECKSELAEDRVDSVGWYLRDLLYTLDLATAKEEGLGSSTSWVRLRIRVDG